MRYIYGRPLNAAYNIENVTCNNSTKITNTRQEKEKLVQRTTTRSKTRIKTRSRGRQSPRLGL